jgi:hypothetical protein
MVRYCPHCLYDEALQYSVDHRVFYCLHCEYVESAVPRSSRPRVTRVKTARQPSRRMLGRVAI